MLYGGSVIQTNVYSEHIQLTQRVLPVTVASSRPSLSLFFISCSTARIVSSFPVEKARCKQVSPFMLVLEMSAFLAHNLGQLICHSKSFLEF